MTLSKGGFGKVKEHIRVSQRAAYSLRGHKRIVEPMLAKQWLIVHNPTVFGNSFELGYVHVPSGFRGENKLPLGVHQLLVLIS